MKGGRYKWAVLALLSCAYFFHQADRAIFGVLTPEIQSELGLDDVHLGWINLALSWTIAVVTPLAGLLAARVSRKWLITGSLIFWSVATCLIGMVGDVWQVCGVAVPAFVSLLALRALAVGGGESFYGPAAMALLAAHHRETRSLAFSIHQASLYLGLMASGWIVAVLLGVLSTWRNVFIAFGATGFLLGLVFVFALKEKNGEATSRSLQDKDGSLSTGGQKSASPLVALKAFFGNPSALFATAGFVAIVCANNAYLFWGVKFAVLKFTDSGITLASAKTATMLWHHVFAFAAILVGGVITDCFVKGRPRFRLGFQIISLLCGAPVLVWLGFTPNWASFLVAGSAYGIFRGFFEVNTHASVFDVIEQPYRSTAVGCMLLIAFFIGGVLSGWVMGILSRTCGLRGFEIGFALMGGIYVLAAALMSISFFFTFKRNRIVE